jgi:hypothetical protein
MLNVTGTKLHELRLEARRFERLSLKQMLRWLLWCELCCEREQLLMRAVLIVVGVYQISKCKKTQRCWFIGRALVVPSRQCYVRTERGIDADCYSSTHIFAEMARAYAF